MISQHTRNDEKFLKVAFEHAKMDNKISVWNHWLATNLRTIIREISDLRAPKWILTRPQWSYLFTHYLPDAGNQKELSTQGVSKLAKSLCPRIGFTKVRYVSNIQDDEISKI